MNLSIVTQNFARKCSPVYKKNFVIVCRIRYFLIKRGQYRAYLPNIDCGWYLDSPDDVSGARVDVVLLDERDVDTADER